MNRRHFLASGTLVSLASSLNLNAFPSPQQNQSQSITGIELLPKPYDSQVASLTYNPSAETAGAPPTPNGLLYYDKSNKKFVSPMSLTPTRPKGSYSISSTLRAFNLAADKYQTAQQSKQEVQIGLNFTAPITSAGDNFAWILKNAVNIFLGKQSAAAGALASFQSSSSSTAPTSAPTSKVQVLQGAFDLQVNAFFQHKGGLWRKLFQALGGVPGSPLLATLGIPGIALEGLQFVMYSLNKLTQNEPLIPLWNPQPLPFALTKDVTRDFNFQDGLWCITDSSVLKSTNLLAGYQVDIADETYQVLDPHNNPLNANYVVAQFDVDPI
jgi:hypothetical protein